MPSTRLGPSNRALLLAGAGFAGVLAPSMALACGVSGPDGVSGCSLSEHEESARPKLRAGVSALYTRTTLTFGGADRGDQTRAAVVGSLAYDPTRRVSLRLGLGAALGGELDMPAGRSVFTPGPTALAGATWRALTGSPFLALSADLSFLAATTRPSGASAGSPSTGYEAFDLRLGAAFGTTLFDRLSPYAVGRVFGGPVYWHYLGAAVTGTDVSHYQLGAGIAWLVARRVDVFAEGVPLGERAVAGGMSVAF